MAAGAYHPWDPRAGECLEREENEYFGGPNPGKKNTRNVRIDRADWAPDLEICRGPISMQSLAARLDVR